MLLAGTGATTNASSKGRTLAGPVQLQHLEVLVVRVTCALCPFFSSLLPQFFQFSSLFLNHDN